MALICISLIISDIEHLSCACWPSVCRLWKNVCLGLLPTFYWVVCFFDIEVNALLYILDINPLSVALFANIFFYLVDLEKAMAPHSSTLAWRIPWMEEPGALQSMESLTVGHD